MIWIDLPLATTAIFFFVISFLYGWGLLQWHRDDFAWDLAATIGIASIVSCSYSFVWIARLSLGYEPIPTLLQIPYDLAIVFLAALPGMTWVRVELERYKQQYKQEKDNEIRRLRRVVAYQNEKLRSIQNTIKIEGEEALPRVESILKMSTDGAACKVGILN